MVTLSSFTAALGVVGVTLLFSTPGALATPGFTRNIASPSYRSSDICPELYSISGANTRNWTVYPSFSKMKKYPEAMFYSFSLHDSGDEKDMNHKIYACSSYGPDFGGFPAEDNAGIASAAAQSVDVEFEMGWFREGFGLAKAGIRSIVKQMRVYAEKGHGNTEDRPFTIYDKSGQATVGLYIGQDLLSQGVTRSAFKIFHDSLQTLNVYTPSMAMQLCGPKYRASHIFGIIATSDGTFTSIQDAIKSWANASCLEFEGSTTFSGAIQLTAPLRQNQTAITNSHPHRNLTVARRTLHARGECSTVQVESGDSFPVLAAKCGVSPADFTKCNDESGFCSKLMPKQHVYCSEGDLPDFSPRPNEDGSCFTSHVEESDSGVFQPHHQGCYQDSDVRVLISFMNTKQGRRYC